ncbi:MAG TPA: wax ester/triacylglycerol synthase family O-acyltransferase, partial [Acidimicrobiales bacterium]|nr:wax ester/triacylglycerol synthase family O-acyltransferase [Acidimicrobiales bacterium]
HIAVPPPGGAHQLATLAEEIVARPLDRRKPLWESWIIEGLEHGHIAVLTKTHHAAIDGVSGNEMTLAMLDTEPEGREIGPDTWKPEHVPNDFELMGYAMRSLSRQPGKLVTSLGRTTGTVLNLTRQNRRSDIAPPPAPFSAPRASWNHALSPHRSYAMTTLSLEDAKTVKNAFGTTLNDVVMAMCASSLRSYLDAKGEKIDAPLVAMVPMSVRSDSQSGEGGNRISSMLASLATTIDDPVERLLAISAGMRQAKDQQNAIGASTLQDWAEFAAPAVFGRAVRTYARYRLADRHRPIFNLTISNVPGPPFPLYSAGARVVANYPMGPINDGAGLNITVLSYMNQLDFGVVTCRELIPDAWVIADGLGDALDELKDRAVPRPPKKRKQAKVVLVHGAWHGPWCWEGVVGELEARGVTVAAVDLPLTSYADDVAAARRAIKAAGKGAVVCGHSYGGMVISQAASGLPVGRVVYLTAFMTDEGEEPMQHMQEHPSPMMSAIRTDGGVLSVDPAMLHEAFYEDSDAKVVADIEKLLRPMPLGDTWLVSREPAWRQAPSTYVVCTNDKAISEGAQRAMAVRADEVVEWDTDHSPFLTRPGDIADLLAKHV